MPEYYDRQGNPIDYFEWARLFEQANRRVAFDAVDGAEVSTVFLGMNHRYDEGPPLIFETMVFKSGSSDDEYCRRYSTEAEAVAWHQRIAECLRAGKALENLK